MESEKDGLLENQYIRNDGKTYQTPKGELCFFSFFAAGHNIG